MPPDPFFTTTKKNRKSSLAMQDYCKMDINDCLSSSCLNGATYRDSINQHDRICADGYADENCSVDIDDCLPQPCMNNGICSDMVNGFNCTSITRYTGTILYSGSFSRRKFLQIGLFQLFEGEEFYKSSRVLMIHCKCFYKHFESKIFTNSDWFIKFVPSINSLAIQ